MTSDVCRPGTTLNFFLDGRINRAEILFPGVACFLIGAVPMWNLDPYHPKMLHSPHHQSQLQHAPIVAPQALVAQLTVHPHCHNQYICNHLCLDSAAAILGSFTHASNKDDHDKKLGINRGGNFIEKCVTLSRL